MKRFIEKIKPIFSFKEEVSFGRDPKNIRSSYFYFNPNIFPINCFDISESQTFHKFSFRSTPGDNLVDHKNFKYLQKTFLKSEILENIIENKGTFERKARQNKSEKAGVIEFRYNSHCGWLYHNYYNIQIDV